MCLATEERALQEADLSSGSLEIMNLRKVGSKMSLKWALETLSAILGEISQILMLTLQELIIDRCLNLVKEKLLLTS